MPKCPLFKNEETGRVVHRLSKLEGKPSLVHLYMLD